MGLEVVAVNLYQTSPLRLPTIHPNFPDELEPTMVPAEFVHKEEEVNNTALEISSFGGACANKLKVLKINNKDRTEVRIAEVSMVLQDLDFTYSR